MEKSSKRWCAVPECTQRFFNLKRYLFRFPKDPDRWLQWVQACGRLDLQPKGPIYAYNNCYLCHLHFEEKWYKINKVRTRLHPDAVPTRFFEPAFDINNTANLFSNITVASLSEEGNININNINNKEEKEKIEEGKQQEINKNTDDSVVQINNDKSVSTQEGNDNRKASNNKPTTSHISSENSPRKRKLRTKILKLKAQNKTLRETIRRLRKEKEKKKKTTLIEKDDNEHTTLRELGHCDSSHANLE